MLPFVTFGLVACQLGLSTVEVQIRLNMFYLEFQDDDGDDDGYGNDKYEKIIDLVILFKQGFPFQNSQLCLCLAFMEWRLDILEKQNKTKNRGWGNQ